MKSIDVRLPARVASVVTATALALSTVMVGSVHAAAADTATASPSGMTIIAEDSEARWVTESGYVVGNVVLPDASHAFRWRDGTLERLAEPAGTSGSLATGVNEQGQVVGVLLGRPPQSDRGVLWQPNGEAVILTPVGSAGIATDIDDSGRILGRGLQCDQCVAIPASAGFAPLLLSGQGRVYGTGVGAQSTRVQRYRDGRTAAFPFGFGTSELRDTNDRGDSLVFFDPGTRAPELHLWGTDFTRIVQLNRPLAAQSALDVSDNRDVTGTIVTENGSTAAFLNRSGRTVRLGVLAGGGAVRAASAAAVNDRGEVVGSSTAAPGVTHAVVWRNGTVVDLGSSGTSSRALDINDGGVAVGSADDGSGRRHAVLWRTCPPR